MASTPSGLRPLRITLLLCVAANGCAAPIIENPAGRADFQARCADPAVLRCFGFEHLELSDSGGSIEWGSSTAPNGVFVNGFEPGRSLLGRVEIADDQQASGKSSLKFYMPSRSGPGFAGQFYANFSDDYSSQFGEGERFYIQWRQRFSKEFLKNRYLNGTDWKQLIVGEGDRRGHLSSSCTQLELVVNNSGYGYPSVYHSCGGKDGSYDRIRQSGFLNYVPDEWMTFQLIVTIGTWYRNDGRYREDSHIELWAAREGESSHRVVSERYDLANTEPNAKYGKVWLTPYLTHKDSSQEHSDAVTWFDELIISRSPIADPIP